MASSTRQGHCGMGEFGLQEGGTGACSTMPAGERVRSSPSGPGPPGGLVVDPIGVPG